MEKRPGAWIMEEPLFHSPLIWTKVLSSSSLRLRLVRVGFSKLGDLQEKVRWKKASDMTVFLHKKTPGCCSRWWRVFVLHYWAYSKSCWAVRQRLDRLTTNDTDLPPFTIAAAAGEHQECEGMILSFKTPELGAFCTASKRDLCMQWLRKTNRMLV
jgi:hypothetical protein